ncbi:MAG: cation:proton antiporter [Candidatus Micrarchaeota archaeon]
MTELLSFLILISAGVFFSELFRRLHLPFVVSLIIAGIIIGPHGLGLFTTDATMEFLALMGLVFLMFMAGLETRLSSIRELEGVALKLSVMNGLFPFLVGFGIATYFGYNWIAAVMLGVIFASSSVAVIIPALESRNLIETKLGKSIVVSTIFEDVFSLVLFSVLLQTISQTSVIPLPLFYLLLLIGLIAVRRLIPLIRWFFFSDTIIERHLFEQDMRLIFVVLIGTVVFFEIIGMHPIIAGFFAGLALSETIKSNILKEKLHAISYGFFIPVFFIVIGSKTDIGLLFETGDAVLITGVVLVGAILSKFVGGWAGGKVDGFSQSESCFIGVATMPRLSTTLAVAFTGLELGILDQKLIAAIMTVSIVTTIVGPLLINWLAGKREMGRISQMRL